jgi:hypothetical protein
MDMRFVAAAILLVGLVGAWMWRYDNQAQPYGVAQVTDRWTGRVWRCVSGEPPQCDRLF